MKLTKFVYSPIWSIFLITAGSVIFSIGIKGIVVHHNFIIGGVYGTSLLLFYKTKILTPGIWFFILNTPMFVAGYIFVSRRLLLYTIYTTCVITISSELLNINFGIQNQLYAAVAGGIICGTGSGLILRSPGAGGGLDIVAIILNQKFNFGIGKVYMVFNAILFIFVLSYYTVDICIASIILVFITSTSLEYILSLFNQRKIVYIISNENKKIAEDLINKLKQGATLIPAQGAYTKKKREILMTVTNNLQLKKVEEIVFTIDEKALFIVENSFNIIGAVFGKRKIY